MRAFIKMLVHVSRVLIVISGGSPVIFGGSDTGVTVILKSLVFEYIVKSSGPGPTVTTSLEATGPPYAYSEPVVNVVEKFCTPGTVPLGRVVFGDGLMMFHGATYGCVSTNENKAFPGLHV